MKASQWRSNFWSGKSLVYRKDVDSNPGMMFGPRLGEEIFIRGSQWGWLFLPTGRQGKSPACSPWPRESCPVQATDTVLLPERCRGDCQGLSRTGFWEAAPTPVSEKSGLWCSSLLQWVMGQSCKHNYNPAVSCFSSSLLPVITKMSRSRGEVLIWIQAWTTDISQSGSGDLPVISNAKGMFCRFMFIAEPFSSAVEVTHSRAEIVTHCCILSGKTLILLSCCLGWLGNHNIKDWKAHLLNDTCQDWGLFVTVRKCFVASLLLTRRWHIWHPGPRGWRDLGICFPGWIWVSSLFQWVFGLDSRVFLNYQHLSDVDSLNPPFLIMLF